MPGRDTAPGFLLQEPSCDGAAVLAKRTQVAKAQHWMERGRDPGHSGETKSEGRPPYRAPLLQPPNVKTGFAWNMIPSIRGGTLVLAICAALR